MRASLLLGAAALYGNVFVNAQSQSQSIILTATQTSVVTSSAGTVVYDVSTTTDTAPVVTEAASSTTQTAPPDASVSTEVQTQLVAPSSMISRSTTVSQTASSIKTVMQLVTRSAPRPVTRIVVVSGNSTVASSSTMAATTQDNSTRPVMSSTTQNNSTKPVMSTTSPFQNVTTTSMQMTTKQPISNTTMPQGNRTVSRSTCPTTAMPHHRSRTTIWIDRLMPTTTTATKNITLSATCSSCSNSTMVSVSTKTFTPTMMMPLYGNVTKWMTTPTTMWVTTPTTMWMTTRTTAPCNSCPGGVSTSVWSSCTTFDTTMPKTSSWSKPCTTTKFTSVSVASHSCGASTSCTTITSPSQSQSSTSSSEMPLITPSTASMPKPVTQAVYTWTTSTTVVPCPVCPSGTSTSLWSTKVLCSSTTFTVPVSAQTSSPAVSSPVEHPAQSIPSRSTKTKQRTSTVHTTTTIAVVGACSSCPGGQSTEYVTTSVPVTVKGPPVSAVPTPSVKGPLAPEQSIVIQNIISGSMSAYHSSQIASGHIPAPTQTRPAVSSAPGSSKSQEVSSTPVAAMSSMTPAPMSSAGATSPMPVASAPKSSAPVVSSPAESSAVSSPAASAPSESAPAESAPASAESTPARTSTLSTQPISHGCVVTQIGDGQIQAPANPDCTAVQTVTSSAGMASEPGQPTATGSANGPPHPGVPQDSPSTSNMGSAGSGSSTASPKASHSAQAGAAPIASAMESLSWAVVIGALAIAAL